MSKISIGENGYDSFLQFSGFLLIIKGDTIVPLGMSWMESTIYIRKYTKIEMCIDRYLFVEWLGKQIKENPNSLQTIRDNESAL